ncbi:Ferritin isoform 2 [Schistosoma japonicum]|uniref:Ferritin n=1 Tax=Schistosoma japonicum TaxID=6182 RepID=O77232_SCHJA|nr:apoferritin-2 [Schistosoma japonicum]KAH8861179.1 ferritin heavy chain [Schistosoma japonicum]TNN10498.1 Ferritin isoform 2 [Schistosoma japonicum]CAX72838.1 Apoferritin-2 [Schistosoma japonicum]CAX72860.1 c-myc binding protein [Schistosoma japonicum]
MKIMMLMTVLATWILAVYAPIQTNGEVRDPLALHSQIEEGLNDQILYEYEAFYIYDHMASYLSRPEVGLSGFAKFFRECANEELEHARKFSEFVNKRNSKVVLKNILLAPGVPMEFKNIHEVIDTAIGKELEVSAQINELHKAASKMSDAITQDFLDEFLREQMNSVSRLREMRARLHLDSSAVYLMDKELR